VNRSWVNGEEKVSNMRIPLKRKKLLYTDLFSRFSLKDILIAYNNYLIEIKVNGQQVTSLTLKKITVLTIMH